ncbi:sorting nexin-16 isoform X2 [Dunckerocampus dactyliophorus]|uniref:sorting nexin-16 isoform X2 n=1 Tax=Dunckerocampus dactyliophorus TaxID=161453 RepID=UPI0024059EEB|nr:sorting nexin-16 isoform X2 [Dunckerocampus dactyliophorus]
MASPFVPVPVPFDRASSSGSKKLRRPQRASSLGSVSSSSASLSPITSSTVDEHGRRCGSSPRQSRGMDRGGRSQTPPPLRSPVLQTRVNGTLERSLEFPSCPRSVSDPVGSQQGGGGAERPITPTVLGYEVMEERAKFTVYKILVRKTTDESWVVFRRYTDFSRLNDKLKEMFPGFRLSLPPKRWFKDNYDSDFLEDRQLGLQAFLQNLVAHKDIANCQAVREFLCLDEPPGPFDSLEESRAFCETLEESNYRLQKELLEKQKEIASLKRNLEEKERAILLLEKHMNGECVSSQSPCGISAQESESSADVDMESSAAEADQDIPSNSGDTCEVHLGKSSACWCGPSLSASPPVIQVTQLGQLTDH